MLLGRNKSFVFAGPPADSRVVSTRFHLTILFRILNYLWRNLTRIYTFLIITNYYYYYHYATDGDRYRCWCNGKTGARLTRRQSVASSLTSNGFHYVKPIQTQVIYATRECYCIFCKWEVYAHGAASRTFNMFWDWFRWKSLEIVFWLCKNLMNSWHTHVQVGEVARPNTYWTFSTHWCKVKKQNVLQRIFKSQLKK
jgi:hypothetical protein